MDLFLYVVIVIVVILKIIFWVFYFYSRYKRKEIQRLLSRVSATDANRGRYEEEPAVPRPAFIFSQEGRTMDEYPAALPAYAEEDPGKIDIPPPPYTISNGAEELAQPVLWREPTQENADSQPLLDSGTPSPT